MRIKQVTTLNWGGLPNRDYAFGAHTLLAGETGSGKTSLIDAVVAIMAGAGGRDAKFNFAQAQAGKSSKKSKRTFASYLTGSNGMGRFLRPAGAHGYICVSWDKDPLDGEHGTPFTAIIGAEALPENETDAVLNSDITRILIRGHIVGHADLLSAEKVLPAAQLIVALRSKYGSAAVRDFRTGAEYLATLYAHLKGDTNPVSREEADSAMKAFISAIAYRQPDDIDGLIREEILDEVDNEGLIQRLMETIREVTRLKTEAARMERNISTPLRFYEKTIFIIWLQGNGDVSGRETRRHRQEPERTTTTAVYRNTNKIVYSKDLKEEPLRTEHPYVADTGTANRLHAARRAAGYRSVRELALKTGWSEAAFRAHETANRHIDDKTAKTYAAGLGVTAAWLTKGEGEGPPVDELRARKFAARKSHAAETSADHPLTQTAQRLRLARRLAGFQTITAAAEQTGLKRSNLAAHEAGQNAVSPSTSKVYAAAFGCSYDWLTAQTEKSSYPPEIDRVLPRLLKLHDHRDREAFEQMPNFRATPLSKAEVAKLVGAESGPVTAPARGERVPEFSEAAVASVWGKSEWRQQLEEIPAHEWFFPPGYLLDVMNCKPTAAFIVAAPRGSRGFREGERLIVDATPEQPEDLQLYVVVSQNGRIAVEPWEQSPGVKIVGRVRGAVVRVLHR